MGKIQRALRKIAGANGLPMPASGGAESRAAIFQRNFGRLGRLDAAWSAPRSPLHRLT